MSRILVEEVIDKAKISPFHWRILFWCTLIIIFDGYDSLGAAVLPLNREVTVACELMRKYL